MPIDICFSRYGAHRYAGQCIWQKNLEPDVALLAASYGGAAAGHPTAGGGQWAAEHGRAGRARGQGHRASSVGARTQDGQSGRRGRRAGAGVLMAELGAVRDGGEGGGAGAPAAALDIANQMFDRRARAIHILAPHYHPTPPAGIFPLPSQHPPLIGRTGNPK